MSEETKQQRDVFKPYPWKKPPFVRENYIEDVEKFIYNDLPEFADKVKPWKDYFNEDAIQLMKPPPKRWERLSEPLDTCIITDDGRVFNTKNKVQAKATFNSHHMMVTNAQVSVDFVYLFQKLGWKYDHMELYETYKKNGWRMYDKIRKNAPNRKRNISKNCVDLFEPSQKEK